MNPDQLAKQAELRKQKKLIKEKLYPFLEISSKDLTDAVNTLDVVKLGIEGAWAMKKNKSTLKSLDIVKGMNPNVDTYKKVKFLLDELQDETVGDAMHIVQSLHDLINTYGSKEISKKKVEDLKSYFIEDFKDV